MMVLMNVGFKYFSLADAKCIGSFSRALSVLEKEKILLDSQYLPVLEAAERGDFFAQLEMQEAFASGTREVPKHYGLARRYTDMIIEYNRGRIEPEIESFVNSASLEYEAGNLESTKKDLAQAIKLMVNNLPLEKWKFDTFSFLCQITICHDEDCL